MIWIWVWLMLTEYTVMLAWPAAIALVPYSLFVGAMVLQGTGNVDPVSILVMDLAVQTLAIWLAVSGNCRRASIACVVLLTLRAILHAHQLESPLDEYTYLASLNVLFVAICGAAICGTGSCLRSWFRT